MDILRINMHLCQHANKVRTLTPYTDVRPSYEKWKIMDVLRFNKHLCQHANTVRTLTPHRWWSSPLCTFMIAHWGMLFKKSQPDRTHHCRFVWMYEHAKHISRSYIQIVHTYRAYIYRCVCAHVFVCVYYVCVPGCDCLECIHDTIKASASNSSCKLQRNVSNRQLDFRLHNTNLNSDCTTQMAQTLQCTKQTIWIQTCTTQTAKTLL